MKKFCFFLLIGSCFLGYGQVGVNTIYPTGVFYVDGATDNTSTSPDVTMQRSDFWIDSRGNVGIGTTTLEANTRFTIRPNVTDMNGIFFDYNGSGVSSISYAIDIDSNGQNGRGLRYINSSSGISTVFFGTGSEITSTNIVSGYTGYRSTATGGLSYALYGVTGIATSTSYVTNSNTWALFSQGRAEISSSPSPKHIANVDLHIRNTYASSPTTVFMRPNIVFSASSDVLTNLDFGDNRVTTPQAKIQVLRDSASSSVTDLPTAMTFSTTADGTAVLSERMRISNNGFVGIATAGAGSSTLSVNGHINFKTSTLNGGPTTGATEINNDFYINLNPTTGNNEFYFPIDTHVPGRMYILRNLSSTENAIVYRSGSVQFFASNSTSSSTSITLFTTGNTKTMYVFFDGSNWIYGQFGFN